MEILPGMLFVDRLVGLTEFLETLCRNFGVVLHFVFRLDLVKRDFELVVFDAHHHIAEHVDQAAVGVVSETIVVGRFGQTFGGHVVESKIQNGIHHPGHGDGSTGADGYQKWIVGVTKLLTEFPLQNANGLFDFVDESFWQLFAIFVVGCADFSCDGETWGYRKANAGHFRKIQAFAAHDAFADTTGIRFGFTEVVDPLMLFCHTTKPSRRTL